MDKNKDEPEICVGIDFGTSNSCVGVYIKGSVKIVPNKIGERITPSVVLFKNIVENGEHKEKIFVGEEALCEPIDNIKNLVYEIKRFIGLDYKQFSESGFNNSLNYKIEEVDGEPKILIDYNIPNGGKVEKKYYSVVEISSHIIKKIVKIAEDFIAETLNQIGVKITSAVFTVPTQFTEKQKQSIFQAAKLAGIKTQRIINEPTAAALAYGIGHDLTKTERDDVFSSTISGDEYSVAPSANQINKSKEKILVFDLGGGTLDITILTITKDNDEQINFQADLTDGDIHLGGSDFDKMLMDYCVKRFCEENELNENVFDNTYTGSRRLKGNCENAKKLLSIKNEVTIQIENFYNEKDLTIKVRRNEFDNICKPLYERINKKLKRVLEDGNCSRDNIDKVILVGGATRMCAIKNLLIKIFGENKIKDEINPDEAVAIGATLEAAKLQRKQNMEFNLQDIIPYNIGIAIQNQDKEDLFNKEILHPIIKRFSGIPCGNSKDYKVILTDKNPDLVVQVYEGNKKNIKDCQLLGNATETKIKQKGEFLYKVKLDIDVNGKLSGEVICEQLNLKKPIDFTRLYEKGIKYKNKIKIVKIAENTNLDLVANITARLKEKKKLLANNQDSDKKYQLLVECSKLYEDLINKYNYFIKHSDSIYEKLFCYTKELFNIYSEILEMKKDIQPIIEKIKERMEILKTEQNFIEELFAIFKKLRLRPFFKDEYYTILCNYMEILINEGIAKLTGGNYIRYYAKLYFEKAYFSIKKYVDKTDWNLIDHDIKKRFDSLKAKNEGYLEKINSFAYYIEIFVKEGKFLFGSTGFTEIAKKIDKIKNFQNVKELTREEIQNILDIFHNMEASFDPKQRSIGEAYCLANIITINYKMLNIRDKDKLEIYIEKFNKIIEGKDIDSYDWYKKIKKIIDEIMKK